MTTFDEFAPPTVVEALRQEGIEDPIDLASWWTSSKAVQEWAGGALPKDLHGAVLQA